MMRPAHKRDTTGTIIYLNGESSSGKTSLARALQGVSDEAYSHLSTDTFASMVVRREEPDEVWDGDVIGPKFGAGLTHGVAATAGTGNNVIVDDVPCESYRLDGKTNAQTSLDLLKRRVSVLAPSTCFTSATTTPLGKVSVWPRSRPQHPRPRGEHFTKYGCRVRVRPRPLLRGCVSCSKPASRAQ